MNLFNEAIYKNHLEHTAAGTKWGKHKYLYITPSGRYVYPEDVQNGAKNSGSKISSAAENAGQSIKKFGQGVKSSYEAGKKAGAAVVTAGKPKTSDQVPDKNEDPKNALDTSDLKKMEINTGVKGREDVVKNIALKFLRGDYGEGDDAKKKLGKYYNEIIQKTDDLKRSGVIRDTANSFKKFGQDVKASYEAGKKAGAAVAEIEKEKKKKQQSVKHSDLEEGLFLMHWGKKRRSGRYKFGSGDRPYQHEPSRHTRKNSTFRDRRRMTDEELSKAISRAKSEVTLYQAERDNRSQGQRFVEDALYRIGKDVVVNAAVGGLRYAGKQFVTKSLNDPDLANALFGGGGGGGKKKKNKG